MDETQSNSSSYFSVPESHWSDVGLEAYHDLSRLALQIGLVLSELESRFQIPGEDVAGSPAPVVLATPADLALQMHEVAGRLLVGVAADEQDLRQIITTLRTAFAVSWDLYSFTESERVTVAEHMSNLRTRIDDFERELQALRQTKRNNLT